MKTGAMSTSLAGSVLDDTRHVCAFFNNDEEEYRALLPFIMDILRTHPAVVIGGILQRHPFFIPPAQFLPELRARREARNVGYGTV